MESRTLSFRLRYSRKFGFRCTGFSETGLPKPQIFSETKLPLLRSLWKPRGLENKDRAYLNSEVLPSGSVVVAVTSAGDDGLVMVDLKEALPAKSVVTLFLPV